jgi:hypothetical protein
MNQIKNIMTKKRLKQNLDGMKVLNLGNVIRNYSKFRSIRLAKKILYRTDDKFVYVDVDFIGLHKLYFDGVVNLTCKAVYDDVSKLTELIIYEVDDLPF